MSRSSDFSCVTLNTEYWIELRSIRAPPQFGCVTRNSNCCKAVTL